MDQNKRTDLPLEEMEKVRERTNEKLSSYGWVDKSGGIARIPIDRAKNIIAEKGLPALEREFARARRHTSVVGVMLHHETDPGERKCATLREFVRWLKRDASVRFATIETIARAVGVVAAAPPDGLAAARGGV